MAKIKELRKSNKYDMGLIESQDLYDRIFNAIDKNIKKIAVTVSPTLNSFSLT